LGGRVDGAEVVEFFGGVVGVDVNGRGERGVGEVFGGVFEAPGPV
jgi:hypothetical protein